MSGSTESSGTEVATLRAHAGRSVCVRLSDGSEHSGVLRTELLTDRSISVFIEGSDGPGADGALGGGEGTTLYIEDIVEVWPTS